MAKVVFTTDEKGMNDLLTSQRGPVIQEVRKFQGQVARAANTIAPARTGNLRRSQVQTPVVVASGKIIAGVEYQAPYAAAVHEGRAARKVTPKNAKALAWITPGGGMAFSKGHNIPAVKGRPWLKTATRAVAQRNGWSFDEK